MNPDTRQTEYTTLTAACGEAVYVRLERDAVKAAEMIVAFTTLNCARRVCRATLARICTCYATSGHAPCCAMWDELPTRGILWADVS